MTTAEQATELRKQLKSVEGKISKLANERIALTGKLEKLEKSCFHQWSSARLVKGTEGYIRECSNCLKVQRSSDVKVKF